MTVYDYPAYADDLYWSRQYVAPSPADVRVTVVTPPVTTRPPVSQARRDKQEFSEPLHTGIDGMGVLSAVLLGTVVILGVIFVSISLAIVISGL